MRKKAESVLKFLTKPRPPRRPGALARGLIFWVLVGVLPFASALNPPFDEAAQGWIRLFDGQSLFGWSSPSGTWKVNEGALVSEAVQQGWLRTTSSFSDFDLKFEAQVSGGPARLLFRADPQSKPAQPGYELSLTDGTIAGIDGGTASPASNGWNSFEVHAEGTHLLVSVNGKVTTDVKNSKNRVGYFEFSTPRGSHVELRSIRLKPLGLDALTTVRISMDGALWTLLRRRASQS